MYRLTYNIYDRAGTFESNVLESVQGNLIGLIIKFYDDCSFHNQIYDVRFKYVNGHKVYLEYQETADILNSNYDKVGHYTIKLVK